MFKHTYLEKGMWRGWLKNGESIEVSWGNRGWSFGGGIHIHNRDDDRGSRLLCLKFWKVTAFIPLGIVDHPWPVMEGPQWSAYASSEFGATFHWGERRKSFDWPWDWHTLRYEQQIEDGSWVDVLDRDAPVYTEKHSYTYKLRSGEVQHRTATVSKRRHVICYVAFKPFGGPSWIKENIAVDFDDEVGERTGSWKGGTVGCGYDLKPGETMLDALRRMESERVFN